MDHATGSSPEAVGRRLRAHRRHRGLRLEDVAEHLGVSPSTVSRLESGRRRATLEILLGLARRYGVTLDELVLDEAMGDPRTHPRPRAHGPMTILPLGGASSGPQAFKVLLRAAEPDRAAEPANTHEGWQLLIVLAGRIRLSLDGEDLDLGPGQAFEFDTRRPHAIATAGGEVAEFLVLYGTRRDRVQFVDRQAPDT